MGLLRSNLYYLKIIFLAYQLSITPREIFRFVYHHATLSPLFYQITSLAIVIKVRSLGPVLFLVVLSAHLEYGP